MILIIFATILVVLSIIEISYMLSCYMTGYRGNGCLKAVRLSKVLIVYWIPTTIALILTAL